MSSIRGTVLLVALCFVTVLGISLAAYIAVCSRTMQLSNRTFQAGSSTRLAEIGLEEGLRAFNKNDWSGWTSGGTTATWSDNGTAGKVCTISFPAGKFGPGVTGSAKIRIDNRNAAQLDSTWNSSATYLINDLVGYSGVWYRCVQSNSNQTPNGIANLAYWVPDPIPWQWSSTTAYRVDEMVNYNGTWYYCIAAHSNQLPTNASYWTAIPAIKKDDTSGVWLVPEAIVNWFGTWYRWNAGGYWDSAPPMFWRWRSSSYSYAFNDLVCYNNTWYRCIVAHTSSTSIYPTNTTYWENALTGSMWAWSSSTNYNIGDTVCSGSTRYRCIKANSNQAPPNTTYWSSAPRLRVAWDSGKQYRQNDTARYDGVWYLCLNANFGQPPPIAPAASSYWVGADTSTGYYRWNSTTAYSAGDYKCYGGVWYKCLSPNTGVSPNNAACWSATWTQSSGVTTGAPVVYAQGTITYADGSKSQTQLRATIAPAPLFPNAAAATTTITANSGGTVDSYDSTTGTSALQAGLAGGTAGTQNAIYGTYASQVGSSTNYSAVVAAGATSGTAITLSSTAVKGYLAAPSASTSPYAPLSSSGGSVKGYSSPASPNIDLARISRSPYIPHFDTLPGGPDGLATNWSSVPKGTALVLSTITTIGTPGATTPSRYYYNGDLTIGTSTIQYLKINGPVILYVNGDLVITASGSTGRIDIGSTGSAEIHVADKFRADVGGEGIQNYTGDPKTLTIICDTTSTATHYYSEGVNDLYGVVYIPYSTGTTGYFNDNNNTEIFGAVSANKITYSGANLNIHYDTSLRYATTPGVDQPWAITEWRELAGATEPATMP